MLVIFRASILGSGEGSGSRDGFRKRTRQGKKSRERFNPNDVDIIGGIRHLLDRGYCVRCAVIPTRKR